MSNNNNEIKRVDKAYKMFYGEDEDDGDGHGAFTGLGALNLREESKTSEALQLMEARLYGETDTAECGAGDEAPEVREEFRRFESTGYDAHTDHVEQHEFRDWQRAFPYLRVRGSACPMPAAAASAAAVRSSGYDVDELAEGVQFVPMPAASMLAPAGASAEQEAEENAQIRLGDALELLIRGSRLEMQQPREHLGGRAGQRMDVMMPDAGEGAVQGEGKGEGEGGSEWVDGEEEIFAQDGVLEEWIEVNRCTEILDAEASEQEIIAGDPVSPDLARRAEVIAILTDAIWPECVDALRPLVERIVIESRKHNFVYDAPLSSDVAVTTYRDEGGDRCIGEDDDSGW